MFFSQVWSLSRGTLLRNIVFPSVIDSIALDPAEHVFYAGSRDGKIYIAALNTESVATNNYGMHIIGSFSNHRFSFLLCVYFKKYRIVNDVLSLDVSFANMHHCFDCNYLFDCIYIL